ncbi:hypothetical protein KH5_21650 [Urechidicola sp. KH5]
MDKETLIKKWLNYELTTQEQKLFEQLDEYDTLMQIHHGAQYFKAPKFNKEKGYQALKSQLDENKVASAKMRRLNQWMKVAAVVVIGFLTFAIIDFSGATTVETLASEKTIVMLPDNSQVQLNAQTSITYHPSKWEDQRAIQLDGEAYFKVAKGATFDVATTDGIVTVVGTEFNIKQRKDYFEVKCFEGKVQVGYQDQHFELTKSKTVRVVNGLVTSEITNLLAPTWINSISSFKSVSLAEVIAELERQFDVTVSFDEAAKNKRQALFTGSFNHSDIGDALNAITMPFGLTYTMEASKIVIQPVE